MTYKRVDGKTPAGGDYAEIHYIDRFGNPTEEGNAVKCIVREHKDDGRLLNETFSIYERQKFQF
jgi:hypothetical protein